VLGPDGTLYVASDDGTIYAFVTLGNSSVAAGSLKWKYQTGDAAVSSNLVLGPDGTLYVASVGVAPSPDGNINAIFTEDFYCYPGNYCPSGLPIPCSPGNYCPSENMAAMTPCPSGSVCPRSGMTSPLACPFGGYCPSTGMVNPLLCAAGTFSPYPNAVSANTCEACFSGSYCPEGSPRSIPCPAGSFYPAFNATQPSDCFMCPATTFSSSGASACTFCGADQTSAAGAETCEPCVPSAFSPSKFRCYSPTAQVLVICGYILSLLSSLFSIYKIRIFVLERSQKLLAAGIKPTLKRVVLLERTMRNKSKRMLLSLAEQVGAASINADAANCSSDPEVTLLVRDLQTQIQQQQQQQQQQQHQMQQMQQQIHELQAQLKQLV
jgi:hypothetical protein